MRPTYADIAGGTHHKPISSERLLFEELTGRLIAIFFRLYDALGFGFLESVYVNAFAHELRKAGIAFEREVVVDVWYDGVKVGHFRADFLIEGCVIVEIKASSAVGEADYKQLLNYLRGTRAEVGLLLHFGPRPAFKRIVYTNDRKPGQHQQR